MTVTVEKRIQPPSEVLINEEPQQDSVGKNKAKVVAPPAGPWTVLVQGVALFSDGYNVQVIGYMNTVLGKL